MKILFVLFMFKRSRNLVQLALLHDLEVEKEEPQLGNALADHVVADLALIRENHLVDLFVQHAQLGAVDEPRLARVALVVQVGRIVLLDRGQALREQHQQRNNRVAVRQRLAHLFLVRAKVRVHAHRLLEALEAFTILFRLLKRKEKKKHRQNKVFFYLKRKQKNKNKNTNHFSPSSMKSCHRTERKARHKRKECMKVVASS